MSVSFALVKFEGLGDGPLKPGPIDDVKGGLLAGKQK
jgi:hypothetical protein